MMIRGNRPSCVCVCFLSLSICLSRLLADRIRRVTESRRSKPMLCFLHRCLQLLSNQYLRKKLTWSFQHSDFAEREEKEKDRNSTNTKMTGGWQLRIMTIWSNYSGEKKEEGKIYFRAIQKETTSIRYRVGSMTESTAIVTNKIIIFHVSVRRPTSTFDFQMKGKTTPCSSTILQKHSGSSHSGVPQTCRSNFSSYSRREANRFLFCKNRPISAVSYRDEWMSPAHTETTDLPLKIAEPTIDRLTLLAR